MHGSQGLTRPGGQQVSGRPGVPKQGEIPIAHPPAWPLTCVFLPPAAEGAGRGHLPCFSLEGQHRVEKGTGEKLSDWVSGGTGFHTDVAGWVIAPNSTLFPRRSRMAIPSTL